MAESTFFCKHTLCCGGKLLDVSEPLVMGILNVTPDSFFDGGKYTTESLLLKQAEKMLAEGASIIDIGGQSTRPGANVTTLEEETKRLLTAVRAVHKEFPKAIISADTFRACIARNAVEEGACIINDISGGTFDAEMFSTVARLNVPYILMHIQGTPQTMQQNPLYENVVAEILSFFSCKIHELKNLGVNDIIIDPGFGFGKTIEDNYKILSHLPVFKITGLPLLTGLSRKSMINKLLSVSPENSLNGTTVLHTIALLNGANILRVHDVKEAVEAIKLVKFYKS